MRLLLLFLLGLIIFLQQAAALPFDLTLGNITVQTDIPALRNGFQVEITSHGESQLPSFTIPLGVEGTSPTLEIYPGPIPSLEEIRHLLGQNVPAADLVAFSVGPWTVNDQPGSGGYILQGPADALGEKTISGQVWIFFQQGPYTCQIIKKLSYYQSETEALAALDQFNESLTHLQVQIV